MVMYCTLLNIVCPLLLQAQLPPQLFVLSCPVDILNNLVSSSHAHVWSSQSKVKIGQ